MPFRTKHTYSTPAGGIVNTKKRTYEGHGRAPAGTKKVKPKTIDEVPVVTTQPDGTITTQGFSSPSAARRAKRRQRRARRGARRAALATVRADAKQSERRTRTRQRRTEQRASKRVEAAERRSRRKAAPQSTPPSSKPKSYSGLKTAGEPTLAELRRSDRAGALRTNRKGFVTTPRVRKTSRELGKARSAVARSGASARLPYLETPEEQQVAKTVLRTSEARSATRKQKLAAIETGLVESHFRNLPGGDADSQGWRQERTSIYGTGPGGPRSVKASASRFLRESRTDPGTATAGTPGQLAQATQASAYPGRYDEHAGEAEDILRAYNRGKGSPQARRRLRKAEAEASALGLKGARSGVGPAPKKLVKRVVVAEHAMKQIAGEPYVWGGGHASFSRGHGEDCSGAVSYVVHAVAPNRMKAPLSSGEMGKVLKPGPGAFTVFYNSQHTFLAYVNRHGKLVYWGTSVGDSGAGGLGPHPAPSAAYLAQYNVGHLPGMGRKQALQLGARFPAGGMPMDTATFPGMTLSEDGTSATIDEGAGVTKGKAGFSSRPIRLTPAQRARRKLRRIRSIDLGGKQDTGEAPSEEASPTLRALEKKYGVSTG